MNWKIDQAHTNVTFSVKHMMISTVHGRFDKFSGKVVFDTKNPETSSADILLEASSINTREPKRDAHLRSADFLDAEKYPHLHFKSKRVEVIDDSHGHLIGDLTIRDITNEVVLEVEYAGTVKSPMGYTAAGFTAAASINRKDWGLNWNLALEAGGWLVGDKIDIDIEIELIKEEVEEEALA